MIIDIKSSRWRRIGYEERTETWDIENGYEPTLMKSTYNPSGDYIGNFKQARYLFGRGITQVFPVNGGICCIGFNTMQQKWYGWSHRAICGFKIGNRIFEEEYGNDQTPFNKHGNKKIECLADAKQAAINFAESVS